MRSLEPLLTDVRRIALALTPEQRRTIVQQGHDTRVAADAFLHAALTETLRRHSTFPVLSEEGVVEPRLLAGAEPVWVLDPLDGSFNYSRGVPLCAISLALWHGGGPTVGVIYDMNRDELFLGVLKDNALGLQPCALLNASPMRTSSVGSPGVGALATGFPVGHHYTAEAVTNSVARVRQWQKVRLLGTAALALAWVACGRLDAYVEEEIRVWDVAAGAALVRAAGGSATLRPTARPTFYLAAATNGGIPVDVLTASPGAA